MSDKKPMTYSEAGVDREKEELAVETILSLVKKTHIFGGDELPEGHFAGSIPFLDYYLSLATDGVGTKILLALELNKLDTIGIDCVAMNTNDLLATNSVPAAFVDYIAIKNPDSEIIAEIMKGLTEGCIQSEIPLIGGETAVLPELIAGDENEFDLAGTALGIQKKDRIITGESIQTGDVILGIESSGVHSNGLTLARKLVNERMWKEKLLVPTRIYVKAIKSLLSEEENLSHVHGMAHITGGGFTNVNRLGTFVYDITIPKMPEIFKYLQEQGNIELREMYRTFNCGIGYILIVDKNHAEPIKRHLDSYFPTHILGTVGEGKQTKVNGISVD